MALITCPECGKSVSDLAKACPECGYPIAGEDKSNINLQQVELASVNLSKMKKSSTKAIITIVCVIMVCVISIFTGMNVYNNIQEQKAAEEAAIISATYKSNLSTAKTTMLISAIEAETACNLIKSVWYNCIYEVSDTKTNKYTKKNSYSFYDDFNDALANLFWDEDFLETQANIASSQETVASLMKKLTNPPDEHKEAYEAIKDLYDAYLDLTNLAVNPSGNLTTYSSNFNDADTEFANCYDKMDMYVD